MNIQAIKTKATPILEKEGVIKAAVFGSHATGEAKQNSVDLLTYRLIHPLLQDIILNEQIVIYES